MSAAEQSAEKDQQALIDALHAERTEAGTTHIDCWACEAAQSKTIADLLDALRRAQSVLGATEAVLARAVPDEDALLALWRELLARTSGVTGWPRYLAHQPRPAR